MPQGRALPKVHAGGDSGEHASFAASGVPDRISGFAGICADGYCHFGRGRGTAPVGNGGDRRIDCLHDTHADYYSYILSDCQFGCFVEKGAFQALFRNWRGGVAAGVAGSCPGPGGWWSEPGSFAGSGKDDGW